MISIKGTFRKSELRLNKKTKCFDLLSFRSLIFQLIHSQFFKLISNVQVTNFKQTRKQSSIVSLSGTSFKQKFSHEIILNNQLVLGNHFKSTDQFLISGTNLNNC